MRPADEEGRSDAGPADRLMTVCSPLSLVWNDALVSPRYLTFFPGTCLLHVVYLTLLRLIANNHPICQNPPISPTKILQKKVKSLGPHSRMSMPSIRPGGPRPACPTRYGLASVSGRPLFRLPPGRFTLAHWHALPARLAFQTS